MLSRRLAVMLVLALGAIRPVCAERLPFRTFTTADGLGGPLGPDLRSPHA